MSNTIPYDQFKEIVSKMLAAEDEYFNSSKIPDRRNKQKLAIWQAYKKKVKEIINPQVKTQQAMLDWLGK